MEKNKPWKVIDDIAKQMAIKYLELLEMIKRE